MMRTPAAIEGEAAVRREQLTAAQADVTRLRAQGAELAAEADDLALGALDGNGAAALRRNALRAQRSELSIAIEDAESLAARLSRRQAELAAELVEAKLAVKLGEARRLAGPVVDCAKAVDAKLFELVTALGELRREYIALTEVLSDVDEAELSKRCGFESLASLEIIRRRVVENSLRSRLGLGGAHHGVEGVGAAFSQLLRRLVADEAEAAAGTEAAA